MRIRALTTAIVSFALLAMAGSPVSAQMTRLNVGYSAVSADQLPSWVAKDAGIFDKNGLDVRLIFFTGGSTAKIGRAHV